MIVAIDGPSGAGKSSVSTEVARNLGFNCLDTGAMYRAIAWQGVQNGVSLEDADAMGEIARTYDIEFLHEEGNPQAIGVLIGGADVTKAIRTAEIDRAVSPASSHVPVREALVAQQQRIGHGGNYVVEGRDIGSVVYPDSPYRFYLDCDPDERARRRQKEDASKGFVQTEAQVKASLLARDKIDSSRKTAPLKVPEGAIRIDTTHLPVDGVVAEIAKHLA